MLSTVEIQTQIDTVSKQGGGTVTLPAGRYLVQSQIVVKPGVILEGVGFSHFNWDLPGPEKGTILDIGWGEGPGSSGDSDKAAIILNEGSGIRNIAFNYPKQDPLMETPFEWGSTVQAKNSDFPKSLFNILIEGCYFFKSYIAMDLRGSKAFKEYPDGTVICGATIRNNFGCPILSALAIDRVADWCTIEDCSFNAGFMNPNKNKVGLPKWTKENGRLIWAGGNDWLQIDNFQSWGYHTGVYIEASKNYPGSGPYTIINSSFDFSKFAFWLEGKFQQSVRIDNCNVTPLNDSGAGVVLSGSPDFTNGSLQFTNNYVFAAIYSIITLTSTLVNAIISHNVVNSVSNNYAAIIAAGVGKNVIITSNIFKNFNIVIDAPNADILIEVNNIPATVKEQKKSFWERLKFWN